MADGFYAGEAVVGLKLNDAEFKSELSAAEARVRRAMASIDRMRGEAEISADLKELDEKMAKARLMLRKWEHRRATATLDVDQKKADKVVRNWETRLRNLANKKYEVQMEFDKRGKLQRGVQALERQLKGTGRAAQEASGDVSKLEQRIAGLESRLRKTKKEEEDADNHLARWIQSVTRMTVRLGPFTTKLNQLGRALLLLGPVVIGLAGALGGLTAVLGAGLIGAVGLGAAGLAGMALAGVGLMTALKPLGKDIKSVRSAQDAYNKAVLKYGDNSKQAKKALDQYHSTLKGVSRTGRQGFEVMQSLSTEWTKFTKPTRFAALDLLGQGVKTLSDMMPMLARNTNDTAQVLDHSLGRSLAGLRSNEGQGIIDSIFGNFNRDLPSLVGGINHLAAGAGRFIAAFSGNSALGGVTRAFDRWASGVDDLTKNSSKMERFAGITTHAFREVIQFGGAAGRVLFQFFRAGVGPGGNMLRSMTQGLDELAQRMSTVAGQRSLGTFFSETADTVKRLWGVLQPVLSLFLQLSTAMTPVSDLLLSVAGSAAQVANALTHFLPTRTLLQVTLLIGAMKQLKGLFAVRALGSGFSALFGGAGLGALAGATGRGAAANAGAVAARAEALGGAAGAAAAGVGRLSAALQGVKGAAIKVGAIAALTGYVEIANKLTEAANKAEKDSDPNTYRKSLKDEIGSYAKLRTALPDVGSQLAHLNVQLRQQKTALAQTKKGTDDHREALLEYRDTLRQIGDAGKSFDQGKAAIAGNTAAQVQSAMDIKAALDGEFESLKRNHDYGVAGAHEVLDKPMAAAARQLEQALNRQAASIVNVRRAAQGMTPAIGAAEQAMGRLARIRPNLATKVGLTFEDPTQAGNVAKASLDALRRGANIKGVFKIVADSKSAEAAIRRLNNLEPHDKHVKIDQSGGERVARLLAAIGAIKLGPKHQSIAQSGAAGVLAFLTKIARFPIAPAVKAILQTGGSTVFGMLSNLMGITNLGTAVKTIISKVVGAKATGGPFSVEEKAMARASNAGRATGGRFNRPTLLVGEEDSTETVISHNPAYRQRNRRFLAMAASDFGMHLVDADGHVITAAKKGKGPDRRKDYAKHYKIPERFQVGGIPEARVEKDYHKAQHDVDKNLTSIDRFEKRLKSLHKQYDTTSPKNTKKRGSIQKAIDAVEPKLESAKKHRGQLLRKEDVARKNMQAVKNANQHISDLQTEINTFGTQMANAAKAQDDPAYNKASARRHKAIVALQKILKAASKYAGGSLGVDIASKLADANSDALDPGPSFTDAVDEKDLTQYLKDSGLFDTLQGLTLAKSQAGLTLSDLTDDATANRALKGFYEGVLQRGDLTTGERIEATDALSGILQDLQSPDSTPDQQSLIDQLTAQRDYARNSSAINAAFASVAGGPGDIGYGAPSGRYAGGAGPNQFGGVNFTINTLHPGDPSTLREIADAASAGFSYQGGVPSSRANLGY